MNATASSDPVRPRSGALWWFVFAMFIVLAWFGWKHWQVQALRERDDATQSAQRIAALEARVDALRGDQRAQAQRMQQAEAINRVLRDEVLGIGQRAALIEDSVSKLSDPDRNGAQALRLDELEIVLGIAQERLQLAGDLDGARHGYALASGLLDGIDNPAYLSLRQTLAQERAALDAIGVDPRAIASTRLLTYASTMPGLPATSTLTETPDTPWWRRAFARILDVRPADNRLAIAPAERSEGLAAMQIEFTLAQAAIERRDRNAYRAALVRVDAWTQRLWPASPALHRRRAQLQALSELPLAAALPTLGTTLQQLRSLRTTRR